jgi:hypothetical protein
MSTEDYHPDDSGQSVGEYEEMYGLVNELGHSGDIRDWWPVRPSDKMLEEDLMKTKTVRAQHRHLMKVREAKPRGVPDSRILDNEFYVGAHSALDRSWGHRTLDAAIKHAERLLDEQDKDFAFVVQIVRVVRRKRVPVEVVKLR